MGHAMRRAAAGLQGFNPITGVAWSHAYWAEGPEFVALGLSDGGAVGTWPDEIGTADLLQATGASRPAYRTSSSPLNNRPVIDSDGNDSVGPTTITTITQPFSVVVVARGASDGSVLGTVHGDVGWFFYGLGGVWAVHTGATLSGGTRDANPHLFRFYANGAASKIVVDETVVATGAAGSNAATDIQLFRIPAAGFNSAADMALAGFSSGDVTTDAGWTNFKAWVTSHYGITVA